MKLCVAQLRSIKGDFAANCVKHQQLIELAAEHEADSIIFPELSLTNYEPELAGELATSPDDTRLDLFQELSERYDMLIGVGVPTRDSAHGATGVYISMVLFRPNTPRLTYSKKYLHADEEPFFSFGKNFPTLQLADLTIAPAICYEFFVPEHAETAHAHGGQLYLASVAKAAGGMARAAVRAPEIATTHNMPVLMANNVGPADNFIGAGRSAVWARDGALLAQLGTERDGLLIYDTKTETVVERVEL